MNMLTLCSYWFSTSFDVQFGKSIMPLYEIIDQNKSVKMLPGNYLITILK